MCNREETSEPECLCVTVRGKRCEGGGGAGDKREHQLMRWGTIDIIKTTQNTFHTKIVYLRRFGLRRTLMELVMEGVVVLLLGPSIGYHLREGVRGGGGPSFFFELVFDLLSRKGFVE